MTLQYIKRWLALLFLVLWAALPALAQDIKSLSPSTLPPGSYIAGLYNVEADNSGNYIKEQAGNSLAEATLNDADANFYFWLVENVFGSYFQIYSATQEGYLLQVNSDGSTQWTNDATEVTTQLLFRMYPTGVARTDTDAAAGIMATGYITTEALSSGYGNADCQCNFMTINTNSRFRLHNSGIANYSNYRPVLFENTDPIGNTDGTITEDLIDNVTRISQIDDGLGLPNNFVSSNFYVGGFGEDDFQITVSSGAEGYIGFLEYTDHHYTKEVYKGVRSPVGIKFASGVISLIYRSGNQEMPFSDPLIREVATNFTMDTPFTLGFKDQDTLVVSQNGNRYPLGLPAPAEMFLNRSVTQSARMLTSLVTGTVEIAYTTKNRMLNSENDFGTDDGSDLASTNAFFPYDRGNALINSFDWQETEWIVRYREGQGDVIDEVTSPFYKTGDGFNGIAADFAGEGGTYSGGEDFSPMEGWELIKANLGYNANGTERTAETQLPYVMLYDRIGSILRVFVYTNNPANSNQLTISLSAVNGKPFSGGSGYTPKLWGSLQQFAALDQVQSYHYGKMLPFYVSSGRTWYFADFVMEYDPCISFFESHIKLEVRKGTEGTLSMIGRLEGGGIPAGTEAYENWQDSREDFLLGALSSDFDNQVNSLGDITLNNYEDFDLLEFQDSISGSLTGAAISLWEKEKAKIEWEAQEDIGGSIIAEGISTIVQGTAQAAGAPFEGTLLAAAAEFAQGLAIIAQGGAQIASGEAELRMAYANKLYYDAIKDKVKEDDQAITMGVPPPRPQAIFGELALQGELTINSYLYIEQPYIATPGGYDPDGAPEWFSGEGAHAARPLYNRPMGQFTLLKQPEFGIGIAHNGNRGGAWLRIKEKPYFAHNDTPIGKIDDILNLAIQIQTLDTNGAVQSNVTGQFHTNLFGRQNGNSLPGKLDISEMIDWVQLEANINTLGLSENQVESHLSDWIRVSYEVWSMTPTTLKSRDLQRVMADGNRYYTGNSSFSYNSSSYVYRNQLSGAAKTITENDFSTYNFSDDSTYGFGSTYSLHHTTYDEATDTFYAAMNSYCTALSPAPKDAEGSEDVKGEEEVAVAEEETEALTLAQPGLTVYPNPAQYQVNFRLVSEQAGQAVITLYDLTGRALVSTTDYIDGIHTLQGNIGIGPLPAGVYILEVQLPDGKAITKKIIKK